MKPRFGNVPKNGYASNAGCGKGCAKGVPTILDVAMLAGTSKSTVSRYLNGGSISSAKATKIEQAIRRSGYSPNVNARRLVQSRSNMLGIVFDDISNYVYGDMMAGIQAAARRLGYGCMFYSRATDGKREGDFLSLMSSCTVDGLIFIGLGRRDKGEVCQLERSGCPIVLVGDGCGTKTLAAVDVDNTLGTEQETAYLIRQGHRRIAYLQGPDEMPAAAARLKGYLNALQAAGIPADPALIRQVSWTVRDANRCVSQLMVEQSFTALIGSNAFSTYGALLALLDGGRRVPEDVALAGFDEHPLCENVRPGITTLKQPFFEIGEAAVERLVQNVGADKPAGGTILMQPELLIRGTTEQKGERS